MLHLPAAGYPPQVKVIDFGKVRQLPEGEGWDDEIGWDEASSPSVCLLIRDLLTQQADVLAEEFLDAIRPLRVQSMPLADLMTARARMLARARDVGANVPQWLAEYLTQQGGPQVVQSVPQVLQSGDGGNDGGQNGSEGPDDQNDNDAQGSDRGVGDLVIRLTLRLE